MIRHQISPAAVLCALLILGACGSDKPALETPADIDTGLHIACQTVQCECTAPADSIFSKPKTAELTWTPNGAAGCPDGFTLKRIETDFLGRPKN